jgi:hypothetical protein
MAKKVNQVYPGFTGGHFRDDCRAKEDCQLMGSVKGHLRRVGGKLDTDRPLDEAGIRTDAGTALASLRRGLSVGGIPFPGTMRCSFSNLQDTAGELGLDRLRKTTGFGIKADAALAKLRETRSIGEDPLPRTMGDLRPRLDLKDLIESETSRMWARLNAAAGLPPQSLERAAQNLGLDAAGVRPRFQGLADTALGLASQPGLDALGSENLIVTGLPAGWDQNRWREAIASATGMFSQSEATRATVSQMRLVFRIFMREVRRYPKVVQNLVCKVPGAHLAPLVELRELLRELLDELSPKHLLQKISKRVTQGLAIIRLHFTPGVRLPIDDRSPPLPKVLPLIRGNGLRAPPIGFGMNKSKFIRTRMSLCPI